MGEIANAMIEAFASGARDDEEAMEMAFGYGALTDDHGFDDDKFGLFDEEELASEDGAEPLYTGLDKLECWAGAVDFNRVEEVEIDGVTMLRLKPGTVILPLDDFDETEGSH